MMRVNVKPELLRWARERAGMDSDELVGRFPHYAEWESGAVRPTMNQLKKFANVVRVPAGCFFLPKPFEDKFPIPDFRTIGNVSLRRPSPDLLDIIYLCQQRQEWYREYARSEGEDRLPFVGLANIEDDVETAAAHIRETLKFDLKKRRRMSTWADALRGFIKLADELGVLVMVSSIVGSNSQRKLDPEEFRGFALADDLAPLIFINGSDTKSAQMFTLAHELAHIWLGQSALSDSRPDFLSDRNVEAWCNQVAAELLVPLTVLRENYRKGEDLPGAIKRLARQFKVSTLVILRRIHDAGGLTREQFHRAYDVELNRLMAIPGPAKGNFYTTLKARVGYRFGYALIASTLGGRASFTESFRLLGVKKISTFQKAAKDFEVVF